MLWKIKRIDEVFERTDGRRYMQLSSKNILTLSGYLPGLQKKSQNCSLIRESGNSLRQIPLLDQPSAKLGEQQKMQESLRPQEVALYRRLRA